MLINRTNLSTLFTGFNAAFTKGFGSVQSSYAEIAMVVESSTSEENYGWLGQFPKMREWVGSRVVMNLCAHSYAVKNKKFESTVSVERSTIEDDKFGVFAPIMQEMGIAAADHPDELIFSLLKDGFSTKCFDGQYFFDADHLVKDKEGNETSVSNYQSGSGDAWFLLDASRAIKPLLYQERIPYRLTVLDKDGDDNVFWQDEYVYGVRARSNAGFGLWQLAYGSKAALDATNYAAARSAMRSLKGDEGRPPRHRSQRARRAAQLGRSGVEAVEQRSCCGRCDERMEGNGQADRHALACLISRSIRLASEEQDSRSLGAHVLFRGTLMAVASPRRTLRGVKRCHVVLR